MSRSHKLLLSPPSKGKPAPPSFCSCIYKYYKRSGWEKLGGCNAFIMAGGLITSDLCSIALKVPQEIHHHQCWLYYCSGAKVLTSRQRYPCHVVVTIFRIVLLSDHHSMIFTWDQKLEVVFHDDLYFKFIVSLSLLSSDGWGPKNTGPGRALKDGLGQDPGLSPSMNSRLRP